MVEKLTKKKLGLMSGPFLLLILAFGLAWASSDNLYTFIRLFDKIAVTVADNYVENIDEEKLIFAGIEGMMEKLDSYSRYLEGDDYFYLLQETRGEYAGIGLELDQAGDSVMVTAVIKDSPASRADISIGDRLIRIDSIDVIGCQPTDCRKYLRGDKGTEIKLKFWRPLKAREIEIGLTRDDIFIESVPYWFIDQHRNGFIKISKFTEGSVFEIKSLISIMVEEGIAGLIIDLRDNPGGLLYESIETAALFLKQGDRIVETKSRSDVTIHTYEAREDGVYKDKPLVVLINGQTASAAEVLAGAIQDNDRGLIVGSASFGKGLVQQIMKFSDHSALKLTTAKYYTPSSRCIQKEGDDNGLVQKHEYEQVLYYTKSGRPVFGGGGIIPDVYVEQYEHPAPIDEIINLGYLNGFAAEYVSNNEIADSFKIDDTPIDRFIEYLNDNHYVYRNDLYSQFETFRVQLDDQNPSSGLAEPVTAIEGMLRNNAENELLALRQRIKEVLFENIIVLSLGEKAACRLARQYIDAGLIKAGEVLENPETYSGLLAGY